MAYTGTAWRLRLSRSRSGLEGIVSYLLSCIPFILHAMLIELRRFFIDDVSLLQRFVHDVVGIYGTVRPFLAAFANI